MNKKKIKIYFYSILFLLCFLQHYSIALQSTSFTSYDQAQTWVRTNPNFTKDSVDTSKSSWIRGAEYYTDDSGSGYLILSMKGKEYIWEGVPLNVWEGFKEADSFGKYYHRYIRGRYRLELD